MKVTVANERSPTREGIDIGDIRIGKDVIEIVTSGMYVSPVTVYREYVQNAADSIDAARAAGLLSPRQRGAVEISFDHAGRFVTVRDNGAGISVRDAIPTLAAIGASNKRDAGVRGFRGVGRLSGLAYCRELQFRTKAANDTKVISLSWDCRALREKLANAVFDGDLRRIISDVVSVTYETAADPADHFFEVQLKDISRLRNDLLLNERLVAHYLSQVAPIPFSPDFSFGAQIEKKLAAKTNRHPLELIVADEKLYRPHRDEMIFPASAHKLKIEHIEFFEFPNIDGEVGATGWIAHHEYVRSILPTLGVRGLRARVGDLQVGDAGLFDEVFKESRFNGWSVGEIHIHDPRIVPNARRDNFEVNHHYYNLLVQLGPVAANISQHCRSASVSRNAEQAIQNVIAEVDDRLKQKTAPNRAELSRLKGLVLRAHEKAKRIADVEMRERFEASLDRLNKKLLKVGPKRGTSVVPFDEVAALVSKFVTNREQATKLLDRLRRLST
ncbi:MULTISPECIES: ATP-binding protein [unclassified Bradyrhizobium]|uniref:ATP-binding protein n=1 Tax=unclassified Bradyrhizobium TaxID=2631580 RepID=UPI0029162BD6|nr:MULTISPECIES: ATP-binding protein [unclassified Bradyrhizobium]